MAPIKNSSSDPTDMDLKKVSKKARSKKEKMNDNEAEVKEEKFPGSAPIPDEVMKKYESQPHEKYQGKPLPRGKKFEAKRYKLLRKQKKIEEGRRQAARRELLHTEKAGTLEAADGFSTTEITQAEILRSADITTQTKNFDLVLSDLGPYRFSYYRDGRHLALCGELGHLATFNWVTKQLIMELNVMESAHDITFMQDFNTVAVAQKRWTSIYDNNGIELHSIKSFFEICKLDYMPYHFLLAGLSETGRLNFVDVSLGKEVIGYPIKRGSYLMQHNPYNGVMATGHSSGIVHQWTPNSRDAVTVTQCHKAPLVALTFDPWGKYMVTADATNLLHMYDARNLDKPIHCVRAPEKISSVAMSQKGLLAIGGKSTVRVYDGVTSSCLSPYMTHKTDSQVKCVQFSNFEDVLGISQSHGFSSIIIPGAGEPNFDASEVNPFSSKAGNRESLVKGLLAKIPTELITLDPATITQVNTPSLLEKLEAQRKLKFIKLPKINVNPRYRMKGKSGSAQMARRKLIRKETVQRRMLSKAFKDQKAAGLQPVEETDKPKDKHKEKLHENILDRFK